MNGMDQTQSGSKTFKGVVASYGIVSGPAVNLIEAPLSYSRTICLNPDSELKRFRDAVQQAKEQIIPLREKVRVECGESEALVFDAHLMILEDEELLEKTEASVQAGTNAEASWMDAVDFYTELISSLGDETLAARSADIQDVGKRVLRLLLGVQSDAAQIYQPCIIVAQDLTPSETAGMDKSLLLGLCTAGGGPTSHTAILAKALNIPALVALGPAVLEIQSKTPLILNAIEGELVSEPEPDVLVKTQARIKEFHHVAEQERVLSCQPAVTREGRRVEVVANIGSREDAIQAIENGAEGVGLLRTEFIYLNRQEQPSEEEQVEIYSAIFDVMGERPVVVRTLDIGGDKEVPYLGIQREDNSFLGWRAIRYCLDNPDLFRAQLRALLRASPGHDIRIMFPMIATLNELRAAKRHYQEVRAELESAGVTVAERIQLGIMVEIPSTAVMAEQFAKEVDFFSIGTNDLTQYTFAADRCNEKVANLGDPCHPAVLRLIKNVITAAHKAGIWVGLCGELAGDPEGVPVLLGLHLDEFSMAPGAIPRAKSIIRKWKESSARKMMVTVLNLESSEEVRAFIRNYQP